MSLFVLDNELVFPPVDLAGPEGLLALGGDLQPERILLAYRQGIFPWYDQEPILWWCPDPRFVLFPGELRVSRSMQKLFRKKAFDFSINEDFKAVIRQCKSVQREGQEGPWITDAMEQAYITLHEKGFAHSAEVWQQGQLVGGVYGIRLGRVFFGESMFSLVDNASKYAFIAYVQQILREGVQLVDCQVYTSHLESLGARMIPRKAFTGLLEQLIPQQEGPASS
ncbi:MAG: leucyl/phenylalanyl-tRNA--protein transferase [Terrimonas sp.]|nr:leucyl/phenylalanyl-tRNA--protein transferase [Terrimonas sp.]